MPGIEIRHTMNRTKLEKEQRGKKKKEDST